jgi:hypothetical protein
MRPIYSSSGFRTKEPKNWQAIAEDPGEDVDTFDELQTAIARLAYQNPGFDVFLRGQPKDYLDATLRTPRSVT